MVGIAIRTRGRRSRLALPSLLVVGARAFGGRGRRSWSWLPAALVVGARGRRFVISGRDWRCHNLWWLAVVVGGRDWRCDQRSW